MKNQFEKALRDSLNSAHVSYEQLEQLRQLPENNAVEVLAYCMRDGDERLREMAASFFFAVVGEDGVKDTSAVPIIIEAVEKEENPLAKRDMIAALGVLGDNRAYDTILAAVDDEIMTDYVLESLGDLGDRRALPVLLRYLDHEWWDFRVAAAYGLGRIGDPAAIPALAKHLDDDAGNEQVTVSSACAIALERIGTAEAMQALRDWQAH